MADGRLRQLKRDAAVDGDPTIQLCFFLESVRAGDHGPRIRAPGKGVTARLNHLWVFKYKSDNTTVRPACGRVKMRLTRSLLQEINEHRVSNSHRLLCRNCQRYNIASNSDWLLQEFDLQILALREKIGG